MAAHTLIERRSAASKRAAVTTKALKLRRAALKAGAGLTPGSEEHRIVGVAELLRRVRVHQEAGE